MTATKFASDQYPNQGRRGRGQDSGTRRPRRRAGCESSAISGRKRSFFKSGTWGHFEHGSWYMGHRGRGGRGGLTSVVAVGHAEGVGGHNTTTTNRQIRAEMSRDIVTHMRSSSASTHDRATWSHRRKHRPSRAVEGSSRAMQLQPT